MKNHALRWGLVVSLLLALVTVSAGAAATAPTWPADVPTSCGHTADDHEGWNKVTQPERYLILAADTKYVLTEDITFSGSFYINVNEGATLCLNGHSITSTNTGNGLIYISSAGDAVTVCDCKETGAITYNPFTESAYTDSNANMAVIRSTQAGVKLNVFGVTFKDSTVPYVIRFNNATASAPHVVNMVNVTAENITCAANQSMFYAPAYTTLNFSDCNLSGTYNTATAISGYVQANDTATVNMKDTTISGVKNNGSGQLKGVVNAAAANAKVNMFDGCSITGNTVHQGGGVFVAAKSGAEFNMVGGTISGNSTTASSTGQGGGVYVAGGTFNMYNGTIGGTAANTTHEDGGAVYVAAGSTFNMYDGTISSNKSTYGQGGGVYVAGTFNMTKGTISTNQTPGGSGCGGGVYVDANGSFTMADGTISGNYTKGGQYGGGVYVGADAEFEMNGGKITANNTASSQTNGAGVYVAANGTFDMNGGEISNNAAQYVVGGGVYVAGTFNMANGTIKENQSTGSSASQGGGVYVADTGSFTMDNGTISGNTVATKFGGGIYNAGTTAINGGKITGNITNGSYQAGGGVYSVGTLTMSGGEVSGSTAQGAMGKDVAVYGGSFAMSGGTIGATGATNALGGYATGHVIVNISGGTVTGQQFSKSGDRASSYYTITITGGNIGTIQNSGNGGVDYVMQGGLYKDLYTHGVRGDKDAGTYNTYTIEGVGFKDISAISGDSTYKYLLAPATNGSNMELGKTLDMNIYLPVGAHASAAKAYATIGEGERFETTFATKEIDGVNSYVIDVPGINATQMATLITVVLEDANGNIVNYSTDSIRAYGKRVLDDETMSAAHAVVADMLRYGTAAQKYFAKPGTTLVENQMADYGVTAEGADGAGLLETTKAQLADIAFAGNRAYSYANLTLDDQVDFNMYFWAGQIGEDKTYTYTINGVASGEGTFEEYLDEDSQLLYKVKIPNLAVADLATATVKISFNDLDGAKEIEDSVYNYLARTDAQSKWAEDGADESGLAEALMAFATSAYNYQNPAQVGGNGTVIC